MNQDVFITEEQNRCAALRAVQVAWTTVKQNANIEPISYTAEELLTPIGDLLGRFQKGGNKRFEAVTPQLLSTEYL